MQCSSCHGNLLSEENFSSFGCPACREHTIIRCTNCRRDSTPYHCSCGFEGP